MAASTGLMLPKARVRRLLQITNLILIPFATTPPNGNRRSEQQIVDVWFRVAIPVRNVGAGQGASGVSPSIAAPWIERSLAMA